MVLRIRYVRPVGEVKGTTAWTESGVGIPRRGVMVRVARFRRGEVSVASAYETPSSLMARTRCQ